MKACIIGLLLGVFIGLYILMAIDYIAREVNPPPEPLPRVLLEHQWWMNIELVEGEFAKRHCAFGDGMRGMVCRIDPMEIDTVLEYNERQRAE
jgi:hypothetical protein